MKKKNSTFIDCTPTWESVLPIMFAVLEDGNEEAKKDIKQEFIRMAKVADAYVSLQKQDKQNS